MLARAGPYGGVYASTAVWPGDGGYLYLPTVNGGLLDEGVLDAYRLTTAAGDAPTLGLVGSSTQAFGKASSSAVVTSDGTRSGSALVWIVNIIGDGALQAYDPVPVGGRLRLVRSWPLAGATRFGEPGVGDDRVYVATTNGEVIGFGSRAAPAIACKGGAFPDTIVGDASRETITLTARRAVTVTGIGTDSSVFTASGTTPSLPASQRQLHADHLEGGGPGGTVSSC